MKRRTFLRGTLASSAIVTAMGAGLLAPRTVLAAWPEGMMKAKDVAGATGGGKGEASADIKLELPAIAENGAVVPVKVDASAMSGVESVSILVESNGSPLAATFILGTDGVAFASTRCKVGKSGNMTGVVKAGGKTYHVSKEVKVTTGGCGG
jgi:sulfur-oxidizing protein SoxY